MDNKDKQASQSQAVQPSDTAEATIEWAQVYYRNADSFTLRDLGIAQAAWAEATRRAHLAGQSQATRAVPDLRNAIMNLPAVMPNSCEAHDLMLAYKIGHRDARHAAAELVNEARAAQEVTKQAAPDRRALLSAAINCGHSIDENKIVLHRDKRKEGNALSQLGDRLNEACASLVSVTHQAAKAETAEQAESDQANVLPPTRGTDGQLDAALATLAPFAELAELFDPENRGSNMPGEDADPVMQWPRLHKHYELTVGHLRAARSVLASRYRAQGGNTNQESGSDLAPTTSTVSAPEVQHIPANFTTHRSAWRDAITACINYEETHGTADQAAYWQHELNAYDRAFARLLDNPEPVKAEDAQAAPEQVRQDWAKWIVQRGLDLPDHACAECVPHGDIIKPGFQCVYHQALALRTTSGKGDAV